MDQKELYEVWAAPFRDWSPWAKPVAFAGPAPELDLQPADPSPPIDVSWTPTSRDTLIVVDLPGTTSVRTGLALIPRGYWPVPLFNAADGQGLGVIPTLELRRALWQGAAVLHNAPVDPNYPPAFLLDSNRMPTQRPLPGEFDNRWLTFPQDFPSANLLISRGVRKAIVLQNSGYTVKDDLAHVLLRWQEAGITVEVKAGDEPPRPTIIAKPRSFRAWWYVGLALLGLRANSAGGFGSMVPIPSQSGSWG